MKRIKINKGKVGLVFRKNDYIKILKEGTHWVLPFDKVGICNMALPLSTTIELNILLKDKILAEMLDVVEVKDGEIVLKYDNGIFKEVLTSGRYAYWKGYTEFLFLKVNISQVNIENSVPKELMKHAALYNYIRSFRVESFEKALLFVNDEFVKELDKGIHYFWKNDIPVTVLKVDLRKQQVEIAGQELLTKDKAALRVNMVVDYKVVDEKQALLENKDYSRQLYVLVQMVLREYIGTYMLDELLEKKEEISSFVINSVKERAENLGVQILDGGIKDIILPGDVKEIMNQVLIAQKKAQANIITRREETASTRSLLNTAKLMEENEMLFKLKEMEYVEKIADKINTISLSGNGQVLSQLRELFSPTR